MSWKDHSQDWRNGYGRGYQAALAGKRNRGVRLREGTFEMRCPSCANGAGVSGYWPLTEEFWAKHNLSACKACIALRKRLAAKAKYWADPETHRARAVEYHHAQGDVVRLKKRARYAEDGQAARAKNAEWREANRVATRAYRRAYYAKHRDHILLREKLRRAGVVLVAA